MNFYFADFAAFIQMGKHGFYVWLCYGVMLVVLVMLVINNRWQLKQLKKSARLTQARKQQRSQASAQISEETPP